MKKGTNGKQTHIIKIAKYFLIGVHIFDTDRKMKVFCKKNQYHITEDTWAIYQPCDYRSNINEILVKAPLIGELVFSREHLNNNIITHESTHAGIDCMRQIELINGLDIEGGINDIEEKLCYYVGDIAEAVFKLLYNQWLGGNE